jgi:hypothetical protein
MVLRMRYVGELLVVFGIVALTGDANAKPRGRRTVAKKPSPAPSSFFLAANPHVPLAVVVDGHVRDAVPAASRGQSCGDRQRWARMGSKWNALDAWGQVVGTFSVSAKDPYDVTGCTELDFSPPSPQTKSHVLVSVDSAWRAPASAEWKPVAGDVHAFDALVAKTIPDHAVPSTDVPSECKSISEHRRFFDVPGQGRFAVGTSNVGYVFARLDSRGWSIVASERTGTNRRFSALCHRPVSIFDMNGDGRPEVILRWSEGTSWSDEVFGIGDDGRPRLLAVSPGGSTA